MIAGKSVLAVIPARGGSKGLPGKNLKPLCGRPMLAWTADAALRSKYVDRVVLSTDDDAIANAGVNAGCDVPFRRPPELATDAASVYDVINHAVGQLAQNYDIILLLQPTSPLRLPADIDMALQKREKWRAPAVVSVTPSRKPLEWHYDLASGDRLLPAIDSAALDRRQQARVTYVVNGAIYAAERDWLLRQMTFYRPETVAYEMPAERSVDVDTPLDFLFARALLQQRLAERGSS